jgi:hypothetical protein
VDHTLRLIQHNWLVLAYNFNVVILVLIIGESCIGAFLLILFITVLSLLLPCIIILLLHMLSYVYVVIPVVLWSLPLFHSTESGHSL